MTDDGAGFDPERTGYGTGLQGMADRLHAHGGSLAVRSCGRRRHDDPRAAALPGARGGQVTTAPARWLAGGLLALTVGALAVSASFGVAIGDLTDAFGFAPVLLAFAGVGTVVAGRRPANPIGWLFLAEGLAFAVAVATDTYARYATSGSVTPPSAAWAAWLGAILGELGFLFALALLLFPDGRLPSPRWRVVAWLIVAAEALMVLMAATSSAALRAQGSAVLAAPVALIPGRLADPVVDAVQTAFLPLSLAAAAGCVVRYRRSTADERHQIKWVVYAGVLTAVALLVCGIVFGNPLGAFLVVGPLIPIAAGIAIMKYRLYDIDVVISKTIVYGSLAAFITAVYVLVVAGIGSLGPGALRPARGQAWACPSWPPRWWRWPSSRSGNGCSTWPTSWCSAPGPLPTRRSASSPAGWAGPTRRRMRCPGWPGCWPTARGPSARWCG